MTSSPSSAKQRAPIAVALDAPSLDVLGYWVADVSPVVTTVKVGLEVFCRDGAEAVHAARRAAIRPVDVFLDLKLHDIPATVAGACRAVAPLRPEFLTVHAAGGAEMIAAAAQALPDTRITAVTILTSLDDVLLEEIGMVGSSEAAAVRLARLAVAAGARAVVCSPVEVSAIRAAVGPGVTLITPGVRPSGAALDDQRRVATPAQAMADGADLLVIGRPITGAEHPGDAAQAIADEISASADPHQVAP